MRARTVISIATLGSLSLILSAAVSLQSQQPPSAPQNTGDTAGVSSQDSANELSLSVGKTVLIDTAKPIARISIGSAEIAEVHATSPTEVLINGKTAGETSLIIWDRTGGRQFFNVSVRVSVSAASEALDGVRRQIAMELPGQPVKISSEGGNFFLRGTVKDLNASKRAVEIASTAGKVVNLLNVIVPQADPQILLKVKFASVDRTKALSLGINVSSATLGNVPGSVGTGQFGSAPNLTASFPGFGGLAANITALENKGIVETLAEPNVLAVNGKEASFLAGGEYPYPMANSAGTGTATITVVFKEYGIRLNFIPTLTPRGTIRLQVAPEVSALDFANSVSVDGTEVPALTTRKMKTEVELADGQSYVLAGLLDNEETATFEKIPFLGDIPILGKFFQSEFKKRSNTELIVIVTPEIVSPMLVGAPLPTLKFPLPFLPPNSGTPMNTPDAKDASNTQPPAPATIPVEKLIESLKPEAPLIVEGGASALTGSGAISSAPTAGGSTQ